MKKIWFSIGSLLAAVVLLLAGCGGGGSSSSATAPLAPGGQGVTLSPVTDPGAGGNATASFSLAVALNDDGQVVGFAETAANSEFRAAIWTVDVAGATTAVPTPLPPLAGHTFSAAFAVDDNGQVVGESRGTTEFSAVIWKTATAATPLPPLVAGRGATAFGISSDGRLIVGEAEDVSFNRRAVIWEVNLDGTIADPVALPVDAFTIGTLPSRGSVANAVNDNGWVAGEVEDGEGISHAVLWRPGVGGTFITTDLRQGLEISSSAFAINSLGQVVGESELTAGNNAAVIWADNGEGEFTRTTIEDTAEATGINDLGRVAGMATAAPLATVWNAGALIGAPTRLFSTASQAYDINNSNLVVGAQGGVGFVKKVN